MTETFCFPHFFFTTVWKKSHALIVCIAPQEIPARSSPAASIPSEVAKTVRKIAAMIQLGRVSDFFPIFVLPPSISLRSFPCRLSKYAPEERDHGRPVAKPVLSPCDGTETKNLTTERRVGKSRLPLCADHLVGSFADIAEALLKLCLTVEGRNLFMLGQVKLPQS